MMRPRTLAAIATLAILSATGCHSGSAGTPGAKGAPAARSSPYAVIANGKVDIEGGVIEIAARRPGVTSEVLVKEGDTVRKGQVLARQEDRELILAVDSARASVGEAQSQLALTQVNVQTAEREHERLRNLAAEHLVSQQQLDQAGDVVATARAQLGVQQSAVTTARARLAQAEYNEELSLVRAPVVGSPGTELEFAL